jgi:hypothetical protein
MGVLTIVVTGTTALVIDLFALTHTGLDLRRQVWLFGVAEFAPEPIGIFQADGRFGRGAHAVPDRPSPGGAGL